MILIIAGLLAGWMVAREGAQAVPEDKGLRPLLFLGNQSLPPMSYIKDDEPVGVVVDLAWALAKRMDRPVEIQLMNWSEAQERVQEGRADALLQINASPERLKLYDFSEPLLSSEFTIFTTTQRQGITSMEDLRGLRVGVEEKGLPIQLLKRDPRIFVEIIPDFSQGFRMLTGGGLDAVLADRWVGSYVLAEDDIRGVKLIESPISRSHSAIAVKKGNRALLDTINVALADIRQDGTYDQIVHAWESKEIVFKTREQLRQQTWLFASISTILVVALVGIALLAREIRRRKHFEKSLLASEERFRLFMDNSPAVAWMKDPEGRHVYISRAFEERFTVRSDQWLGKKDAELWPAAIAEEFRRNDLAVLAGGQALQVIEQAVGPDGDSSYWLCCKFPFFDAAGNSFVGGIGVDITERKRMEAELREARDELEARVQERTAELSSAVKALTTEIVERQKVEARLELSEETFRSLFENSLDGILFTSPDGSIYSANKAACEMLGRSEQEICESGRSIVVDVTDPRLPLALEERSRTGFFRGELNWLRGDGTTFPVALATRLFTLRSGEVRALIAFRDITEHKAVEAALRESERRYRQLFELESDALFLVEQDTLKIIDVNSAVTQLYGYTRDELLAMHTPDIWAEQERTSHAIEEEVKHVAIRWHRKKEGTVFPVEITGSYFLLEGKRVHLAAIRDISERMKLENALRESRDELELRVLDRTKDLSRANQALSTALEHLRLTHETAQAGTWEWDLKTNENLWSEGLWDLYGIDPHSCPASFDSWKHSIHPDDREKAEHAVLEAARNNSKFSIEWRTIDKDGTVRWLLSHGGPLLDKQGQAVRYLGVVMNITERKQSEIDLERSHREKVALLKEIHHRVKNNLQVVASLVGLQTYGIKSPEALDILKDTRNRVCSMALLHEVLYRSKDLARIGFSTYLRDLCRHIVTSFGGAAERINVETRAEDITMPLDKAVPCGLLVNELVSNALKHAFPGGRPGSVVVELAHSSAEMLLLKIQDDGVGLPSGIDLENTPTLGLQLVFDLARQLLGHVAVNSSPGGGAVFTVAFPIAEEAHRGGSE